VAGMVAQRLRLEPVDESFPLARTRPGGRGQGRFGGYDPIDEQKDQERYKDKNNGSDEMRPACSVWKGGANPPEPR
jgi:hypothetical protein